MALAPRALAHAYFAAADEIACDASRHTLARHPQHFGKDFLSHRLAKLGAPTEQLEIGYVLLRAPNGADCWRLKSHAKTIRWWGRCLALSRSIPVYCRSANGTGHPHSLGPELEQSRVGKRMLAMMYAPRCKELPEDGQTQLAAFEGQAWPHPERLHCRGEEERTT